MATTELAVREEFGAVEHVTALETAASAVAEREKAVIQARYIMAMRNPRDIDQFRVGILKECSRPGFAAVARYRKPVGGGKFAEGPSIRFVEAALRCFRNVAPEASTVYDSPELRIIRITVTDLEANLSYSGDIQINKTVERKDTKGREVLSERINSYGEKTYTVRATDDELLVKQSALISKLTRTLAQRLLPGDVVEECMERVVTVQRDADAKDPDAAKKKIVDAFGTVHVDPSDLHAFLGKPVDRIQPADLVVLREVYQALKDGDTTWDEVMAQRTGSREEQERTAEDKIARLKAAQVKQSGSTPEGASTLAAESKSGSGREGSGEQPQKQVQAEEPPTDPDDEGKRGKRQAGFSFGGKK